MPTCLHTDIVQPARGLLSALLLQTQPRPISLLLAPAADTLAAWTRDLLCYSSLADPRTGQRPHWDLHAWHPDPEQRLETRCDRAALLAALLELRDHRRPDKAPPLLIATTPEGLLAPCPSPEAFQQHALRLLPGLRLPLQTLVEQLGQTLGYACEALCENPGEFAVRGGLVDIYPPNADAPVRVDYFGDTIETLRHFDPTTQRTTETLPAVLLTGASPVPEAAPVLLLEHLSQSTHWLILEPTQLETTPTGREALQQARRTSRPDDVWNLLQEIEQACDFQPSQTQHWRTHRLEAPPAPLAEESLGSERLHAETQAREALLHSLLEAQQQQLTPCLLTRNEAEATRLGEIIAETPTLHTLRPLLLQGEAEGAFTLHLAPGQPRPAWLPQGSQGLALISAAQLFAARLPRTGSSRPRLRATRQQVDHLLDFSELAEGDHIVHLLHGIAIYRGLGRLDIQGKPTEVLTLEFAENITLHVPLHEAHLLTRYVGITKTPPKLGKLGSGQWEKIRQAAERATLDLAAELLRVQAQRETLPGHAFSTDTPWQREFENAFPFRETTDQLTAIAQTKSDMERPRPMDRLLCGDVGFGKTEVAMRAAFKAVMDGRQVAVLVPTTVLAQQHFMSFRERMAHFPLTIEMLSRFRTAAQQKVVLEQLRQGRIDILIGTHRLLGKDVVFSDLCLLIVDEEHRFGVRHKEKLKRLRENVDVLSMSATPIPRTLYLALMGARDLSVIETPPRDRLPIVTEVKSYTPELVREAIAREKARGGQVFYLHNRVQSIELVADTLRKLLPGLRVGVGHGQMEESQLEDIMTRFVRGDYDVLVCTTIIESGLDIPNCNTILIEGADRFGLAQLYQLRGRVGRFNRQAYAYLLLHRHARLLDHARKRLSAMKQHNQLGAGFRIAMRDLELRGAGHLLGARQSGHIAGVGFDLYCQLLRQSVARLKGDSAAAAIRATLRLDFVRTGEGPAESTARQNAPGYKAIRAEEIAQERCPEIEASLPASYIPEARLRMDAYRKLALAGHPDAVRALGEEFKDRFGPLPPPAQALLLTAEIRTLAEQNGMHLVETEGHRLKCTLARAPKGTFLKVAGRFPRLTSHKPLSRLREIRDFIKHQAHTLA